MLNTAFGQKIEKTYLDIRDSTANLYLSVLPAQQPWKGVLFLVPGFGGTPESVLAQTDLPNVAAQQGILTIIPTFSPGIQSFGVDSLTQQSFKEIIDHVVRKYGINDQKLFVGGFSIGGSCAVKFAELAIQENYRYKPAAIFAIDPPLDLERFYYTSKRMVRLSVQAPPSQEAVYMITRIEKEMQGTPEKALPNYYKHAPYSFTDTTQTAIKHLLNTPVRLYTEPDVDWWLQERGSDFSTMNALDISAMINELQRLGHKNAFLITTEQKGYRQPGHKRHPHSWSIAEPTELVAWLLKQ